MTAIRRFFKHLGHALSYDNVGNLGELQRRWDAEAGGNAAPLAAEPSRAAASAKSRPPLHAVATLGGAGNLH